MNETFAVASITDCDTVLRNQAYEDDYVWRETKVGCKVLLLLREMLRFNISYIKGAETKLDYYERTGSIYEFDDHIDIYAKPRTFWLGSLLNASPIMPIFSYSFGFTLLRSDPDICRFYSQPFTMPVWHCLFAMFLLVSALFYFLNRAEQRLLGSKLECYISHELLVTLGAYCQHYLPVNPMELTSRRIAFFSFFLFTYVIYSYYTSTLLSVLVHDSDNVMSLEMLADSSYDNAVLDKVAVFIQVLLQQTDQMNPEIRNYVRRKFGHIRVVNVTAGLEEVKTGKTALLSDYASLYPAMKQMYDDDIICGLLKVDLYSNIIKYFFTSKNFKYTEEFKISILRAKETGVLRRLLSNHVVFPSECRLSHFQAQFALVQIPLIVLACSYVLCLFILLGERIYFQRNRLWPYVE